MCPRRAVRVLLTATIASLPFVALTAAATTASASPAPITLAYITDVTGQAAFENGTSPAAFEARIALQNAEGGVHGHKLVPLVIDDQTNPVGDRDRRPGGRLEGASRIVSQSPLFFLAAKYPQQQGIPVTGSYSDGPEWGQKPYTNMFAADDGSVDPKYPVNTLDRESLQGSTAPRSSRRSATASRRPPPEPRLDTRSFKHAGGKVPDLNTTVPFGGVAVHQRSLSSPSRTVSMRFSPEIDNNSNFALAEALNQAGVKLKAALFATGYEPDVINSPAWSSAAGRLLLSLFRPWVLPNAGTQQMQAAMEKYADFTKSDFPSFSQYEAWLGADLMIKGLNKPARTRPGPPSSRTSEV